MHPPPPHTHTHMHTHYSRTRELQSLHHIPRIQTFLFSFWSSPTPFFWSNFCMSIFSSDWWAVGGEIWSGDLLHVSLGDSQGVNYVAVAGQPYLWEACQVFRCWSEMCGLKRLLHCKSGHTGHVCLDSVCLRVSACVWGLVFTGRLCNATSW